jgi:hypothetical protein
MSHSTLPDCESNSTSTLAKKPGVLVVRKHHFLVRWSHWLNVPILLGLFLSGISILLGFADLSAQARSEYGKLRCGGGYWNLDMRSCAWTASLQQSTRLDLQPHEPRAVYISPGSASPLAVRVLIHAEWSGVPHMADHGRRLALLAGAGKTTLALAVVERLQQTTVSDLRVAIVVPFVFDSAGNLYGTTIYGGPKSPTLYGRFRAAPG